MIWKAALHYARFWLVLALAYGQLTAIQKKQILDLHNKYRSTVRPEAADMLRLTWDEELSLLAENYSAQCIWAHNPALRGHLGENLYITTDSLNISKSMVNWFNEHKYYNFDNNRCESDMCGHYTQIVWAKSNRIGCASHFCETVPIIDFHNSTILICNYSPNGNQEGVHPYVKGKSCSRCPQNMPECVENTCAEPEEHQKMTTATWRTGHKGSADIVNPSVATLLLAGLMVSFII